MNALKALVIFMGILIVLGMGLFAWGISMKLSGMAETEEAAPVTAWAEPVDVALPPGARVTETRSEDGHMIVTVRLENGDGRILVFDLETGEQIGMIRLNQKAGAQ